MENLFNAKAKICSAHVLFFIVFMIISFSLTQAQDLPDSVGQDTTKLVDNTGKFKLEGTLNFGFGSKNLKVGETTDNSDINISGGGGIGGSLALCYGLSSMFEINFSAGYQNSPLSVDVDNAEGSFKRMILLATIKDKIPVSSTGAIKLGAGIGYYIPNDLDIDFSKVTGGGHNTYSYDPKVGFHIIGEYEINTSNNLSWGFGIKYYNVTYDLKSAKSNGVNIPLNFMPNEIKNETEELDGSGVDFSVFIAVGL